MCNWILRRGEREWDRNIFEEIMAKNPQFGEINSTNPKQIAFEENHAQAHPKVDTNNQEEILAAAREKCCITSQGQALNTR